MALIQQVRPEEVPLEQFLGKVCMLTAEEILFIPGIQEQILITPGTMLNCLDLLDQVNRSILKLIVYSVQKVLNYMQRNVVMMYSQ